MGSAKGHGSGGATVRRLDGWTVRHLAWATALLLTVYPSNRLSGQAYEQRLLAIPDTASVRQMSKDLSAVPHMAGTPAQAATRDYVLEKMKSWGIDAWSKEYTVFIPQPDTVEAWIVNG